MKLVQNGASARMKRPIWYWSFCTFIARKYATGKPKRRQAATAMTEIWNDRHMSFQ